MREKKIGRERDGERDWEGGREGEREREGDRLLNNVTYTSIFNRA